MGITRRTVNSYLCVFSPRGRQKWYEEEAIHLIKLWNTTTLTKRQIADIFDTTINAIIGKLHRLRTEGRIPRQRTLKKEPTK